MRSEPSPIDTGAVIILNGASSSGKSTLAHRMHRLLDLPFLLLSGDQLIEAGVLPPRRDPTGPFAWVSQMRPRFFDGLHRCIPALAAAGNNVLVEHVVEHRSWRRQLDRLLDGYDVPGRTASHRGPAADDIRRSRRSTPATTPAIPLRWQR